MSTMTAALYDGAGSMKISQIPAPVAGPGEALVSVRAAGICGSDLLMNVGRTDADTMPAGHEVTGEIVAVGDGVDPTAVGRRVAIDTIGFGRACQQCWYCRTGQYRSCVDRTPESGGAFAQYMTRLAAGCFPLPENLSWHEGALVEPLAVSIHGMRRGGLKSGETVAILGTGNIGLTAVAAAKAMGAGRILVTARHPHQADMARKLGANIAVTPEGDALQDALMEVTEGRGADLTLETVGGRTNATLRQAVDVTRVQGRIVVLGGFHAPITLDWLPPLLKEQSFIFSSCYSVMDGRHDFELAIGLMASGSVDLGQMVTHELPLVDMQRGFDTAYDKTSGSIKVQIHN